jgi:hypothetical protein
MFGPTVKLEERVDVSGAAAAEVQKVKSQEVEDCCAYGASEPLHATVHASRD